MKQLCFYTVAKFIPDLIKNEPRNIGILFFDADSENYKSKFVQNPYGKLGKSIMPADVQIIKQYEDYFDNLQPASKNEIETAAAESRGKIQFSDIKTVVTKDFDSEFDYLYSLFIGEDAINKKEVRHRLKTSLKENLKRLQLIGENRLAPNKKIRGKSTVEHSIDFSYQNGALTAIETVDFAINSKDANVYQSAFKFDDLKKSSKLKVKTISIISKSDKEQVNSEYLSILKSVSDVYDFGDENEMKPFYNRIKKVIV